MWLKREGRKQQIFRKEKEKQVVKEKGWAEEAKNNELRILK